MSTRSKMLLCAAISFVIGFLFGNSLDGAGSEAGFLGMALAAVGVGVTTLAVVSQALFHGTRFANVPLYIAIVSACATLGLVL